ncbi:MAG: ABC transporter ATP-binding protein, partial [Euryarchaeota archaeon]|nr:ABC transporter ATP-binding protein [Euryarchaeota archaeon]
NLASLYCDMLVMLKKGRVVAEGTPEEVITPRRIREVYGCEVCVVEHPLTGKPQIVPVP